MTQWLGAAVQLSTAAFFILKRMAKQGSAEL